MQYPIVYDKFTTDFTSLGLAVLENASSVKIKEVINGEFLLSFILPRNDPKWQYIQPENFVKVYDCSQKKDQLFRVRSFDEQRDSTGKLTSNVQCEHVYYDAQDCKFFPSVELIGQTPTQILQYAFSDTRFTIGTVEIATLTDIILDKIYPKQIVDKLIENVGGELVKDNWTINLVTKRGSNTGVQLRYGKNQASLKKSTDNKSVITRLYPYGKDGLQIEGTLGYIDSPLIGNYDRPKIGHLDYSDIEDPAELLSAALKEWSTTEQDGIDKPKVTYSGEFIELNKLKEYGDTESYGLGDVVRIIDEGLGVNTTQRIMEYEYYPYEAKRSTVSLSNTSPSVYKDSRPSNVIASTIQTSNYVSSIKDSSNKLDPGWFQNIKTRLKTFFNGQIHKAVVHTQGDIWVDNPDNPTMAMAIISGGFAIANSKDSNGNWEWKTFGTAADGFVADLITAGILKAIEIQGCTITGNTINGGTINGTTINGGTIIGTLIKTALEGKRIELSNNTFKTFNDAGNLEGLAFGTDTGGAYGDLFLYSNGVKVAQLYNTISDGYVLIPLNGKSFTIGGSGSSIKTGGTWNCSGATFSYLSDGTYNYATTNYVDNAIATAIATHLATAPHSAPYVPPA